MTPTDNPTIRFSATTRWMRESTSLTSIAGTGTVRTAGGVEAAVSVAGALVHAASDVRARAMYLRMRVTWATSREPANEKGRSASVPRDRRAVVSPGQSLRGPQRGD